MGTALETGRFQVAAHRGTRAPSEEHRAKPAPKRVVREAHPAGPPLVADVRAVADVGDDEIHEQGKIYEIHKSESALHKDLRDLAWYRDVLHSANPAASAATSKNINRCCVAAATENV